MSDVLRYTLLLALIASGVYVIGWRPDLVAHLRELPAMLHSAPDSGTATTETQDPNAGALDSRTYEQKARANRLAATLYKPPTEITTVTGKTYRNVKITKVEADGILISHDAGNAQIPFRNLTPELKEAFGVDPRDPQAVIIPPAPSQGAYTPSAPAPGTDNKKYPPISAAELERRQQLEARKKRIEDLKSEEREIMAQIDKLNDIQRQRIATSRYGANTPEHIVAMKNRREKIREEINRLETTQPK